LLIVADGAPESVVDFSEFDSRGYRTVDVRAGYAEWVARYDQTVEDAMICPSATRAHGGTPYGST
jgi:hypothetical protein